MSYTPIPIKLGLRFNRLKDSDIPFKVFRLNLNSFPNIVPVNGSEALNKLLNENLKQGTRLLLDDGDYSNIRLNKLKKVALIAKNRYKVIVDKNIMLDNCSNIRLDGLVIRDSSMGTASITGYQTRPTNKNIYITDCSMEDGEFGIYAGANADTWTVENTFFEVKNNYGWYMVGKRLTIINSIFTGNTNHDLNIRGHFPNNIVDERDVSKDYLSTYADKMNYFTHRIYRCSFLPSNPEASVDVNPKSRGNGIYAYHSWDDGGDELHYLPPKDVWIEGNLFIGKKQPQCVWLDSEYGYPNSYKKGDKIVNGIPVITGTKVVNNVGDRPILGGSYNQDLVYDTNNSVIPHMHTLFKSDGITIKESEKSVIGDKGADYTTSISEIPVKTKKIIDKIEPKPEPKPSIEVHQEVNKPQYQQEFTKEELGMLHKIISWFRGLFK